MKIGEVKRHMRTLGAILVGLFLLLQSPFLVLAIVGMFSKKTGVTKIEVPAMDEKGRGCFMATLYIFYYLTIFLVLPFSIGEIIVAIVGAANDVALPFALAALVLGFITVIRALVIVPGKLCNVRKQLDEVVKVADGEGETVEGHRTEIEMASQGPLDFVWTLVGLVSTAYAVYMFLYLINVVPA